MRRSKIDQNRIILIARLILIVVTVLVGTTVFFVMKGHAEHQLLLSLESTLENYAAAANASVERSLEKSRMIATRPFFIDQIGIVNARPGDTAAVDALRRGVHSFLSAGFAAITLFGKNGHEIVQAGRFVQNPEQQVSLKQSDHSELLYENEYFLRTTLEIVKAGAPIGWVTTVTALPTLTRMFAAPGEWGKTAELAMCASAGGNRMHCFPSTQTGHALEMAQQSSPGQPLPMTYALRGETGAIVTRDYRHKEVVATFSPVGHLGLGMVLKIDSRELYAPVWGQLRHLLPLLIVLLAAALLSLRWLFTPLVTELVRSERETHEANERLRHSENRIRMLVNSVDEGIVSISQDGLIELFNPGAERMFGYRSEDVLGKNVSLLMSEPHRNQHDEYLQRYLKTGETRVIGNPREVVARRSDGSLFPMELRVSQLDLKVDRKFIGIMYDISARKAIEQKVAHLAHHDALTNLPNRRLTQDRIQQAIARAHRTNGRFAVMFVDLDGFKNINDTLGHDAGDQLLQIVARRLTACLRAEDTVGRQGGDEFIVLLANLISVEDDAILVAEKILYELSLPFAIEERDLHFSASIGIAVYPQDGTDFDALVKNSDAAMYQAKKSGGRRYSFATAATNATPDE